MLTAFCIGLYVLFGAATFLLTMIAAPSIQRRVSSWSILHAMLDFDFPGPYLVFFALWPIGWCFVFGWIGMVSLTKFTKKASVRLEKFISSFEK